MSDSSTELLDQRLQNVLVEMRAGKKPNFVAFLKEVPQRQRASYLRPILRCHLEVRQEHGKELSANLYQRFGKKAVEIAEEEIRKLVADPTSSQSANSMQVTMEIDGQVKPSFADDNEVSQPRPEQGKRSSQFEMTQDSNRTVHRAGEPTVQNLSSIDRYRIDRMLGEGGFGSVYLGFDEKLERSVAIKLPHASILEHPENVERYLNEARTVANLDHQNIVPVHDVGTTDEHPFYIVSKFIEGKDLDSVISEKRLTFRESTQLVATIAKGLHHAHKQGIVHRDIKPGNILVDNSGVPHIVDFGLAWRDQDPMAPGRQIIGSPAYMSPEQARGEGHRIDGRSDIFSLGILFYELLTGRRPFNGSTITEVLGQILRLEPRPLRQYDERIPYELERICLKAISKKAEQRYSTAFDLAEDLEICLQEDFDSAATALPKKSVSKISLDVVASRAVGTQSSNLVVESKEISIIPKGLRSFDVHDADFFLQLLPSARDRFGFPDCVRFWRTKIEDFSDNDRFAVGLIYGPSGCGKSSFIKSGLLPHLSDSIVPVYIESTPEETESRLLGGIQRQLGRDIDGSFKLPELIAEIRRGAGLARGKKLLLVLDQFEQWLHARTDIGSSELVNAIRQCDGNRVQCIVSVRDDFWMAATRFMKELEIRLEEGHNSAAVDLFPARHAYNVLMAFGRAYGAIPQDAADLTDQHKAFLEEAVDELQVDQKVICVRLALFAEMMKNREWSPHSLAEVGGIEGLRVSYLEETFGQQSSHPKYRLHENGVRSVLKQLMPEPGTDIKGKMKSWNELKRCSEYDSDERFEELLQVLDNETRLITPTDREGSSQDAGTSIDREERCYQLAHDYLVPSIDTWLALKQRETKRGRTELLLESRSSLWNAKPENRQLPTLVEYLGIRRHTKASRWSKSQKMMMGKASKFHGFRAVMAALGTLLVAGAGWLLWHRNVESGKRQAADSLVNTLLNAKTEQVPQIVSSMDKSWPYVSPIVQEKIAEYPDDSTEWMHLSLSLAGHDASQVDYLLNRLEVSDPEEVSAIRVALNPHKANVVERLWSMAKSDQGLLPTAAVLASSDPESQAKWESSADRIVDQLLKENVLLSAQWLRLLDPVDEHFYETLKKVYLASNESRTQRERDKAKDFLVQSARKDWAKAAELMIVGEPGDFNVLIDLFSSRSDEAKSLIDTELQNATGPLTESNLTRATNAAIAALKIGQTEAFLQRLKQSDDPSLRTSLIANLKQGDVGLDAVWALRQSSRDPSVDRAILQILGSYEAVEPESSMVNAVLQVFELNPDPGIHSSARWLLCRWGKAAEVDALERKWSAQEFSIASKADWFVTHAESLPMVVVRGPVEFDMGSPESESGRGSDEALHRIRIDRSFAIGATEVTVGQFKQFRAETGLEIDFPENIAPTDQHPMIGLSWFQAASFCRWLSEKEGLEESQMCYPPIPQIIPGMKLPADFLTRTGYRLPTEAEWEFSCRSNTVSSRFHGDSDNYTPGYAWGSFNTRTTGRVAVHLPNGLGLFDTHGNVGEWCQQVVKGYAQYKGRDQIFETVVAGDKNRILRGGSFTDLKATLRSALRTDYAPTYRTINFGLRVARTIQE